MTSDRPPPQRLAAVVLAAGAGRRLRPLTDLRPKALCPVNNVPLVDHALERVRPVADAVAVNVHHGREPLVAHLSGRVHLSVEKEPLETAGGLGRLRSWIDGRDVLVCNADTWHPDNLVDLLRAWDRERVRLLTVRDADRPDFGDHRYTGAALLPWAVVRRLPAERLSLYRAVLRPHWDRGALELVASQAPFFDCGTPADYLAANLTASGGVSVIGPGAVVAGRVVRSVVWPGARVERWERLVEVIRATTEVTVEVRPAGRQVGRYGRSGEEAAMAQDQQDEQAHPETLGPKPTADERTLQDAGLAAASEMSIGVAGVDAPDRMPDPEETTEPRREGDQPRP